MMKFRFFVSTLVAFAFASSTGLCDTAKHSAPTSTTGKHAKAKKKPALFPKRSRLVATVSHNEYFPPLPESLRPGAIFNAENVDEPSASKEDLWYKVPNWISGEFSYGAMTIYLEKNLETGAETNPNRTHPGITHGRQRGILMDKVGNIWQKAYGGSIVDPSDPNAERSYELKKYDDELFGFIVSPNKYVENSAGVEFFVDRESGKIQNALRWERIRDFSLEPDGSISCELSEERFDLEGKPVSLNKARGKMVKRQSFEALTAAVNPNKFAESVKSLRKFMDVSGDLSEAPELAVEPATPVDENSPKNDKETD